MMDILQALGVLVLISIIIAFIMIWPLIKLKYKSYKNDNKKIYLIINETGNVFKEYNDKILRDIDLEEYKQMGYDFKADIRIITK